MPELNLASIDLNLLNVVATVLETGSATKAAAKLHVTQSAVSNALRRARALFGDPLVLREPHGLRPTARGDALAPELRAWLEEAKRLLHGADAFEPARSGRTFTIACSDAVALVLLGPLLRRLSAEAPNVVLRLTTLDRLIEGDGLARGEVDLLIGIPPVVPPGHRAEAVYVDPMRCVVRRDHPRVKGRLGLDTYTELPHVELALFSSPDDAVDRALAAKGRVRRVAVAVPHFSVLPVAVAASDAVATLGLRLATVFAERHGLEVLAPPVPLPALEIRQVWHRRADTDRGLQWLRAQVVAAARETVPTRIAQGRAARGQRAVVPPNRRSRR